MLMEALLKVTWDDLDENTLEVTWDDLGENTFEVYLRFGQPPSLQRGSHPTCDAWDHQNGQTFLQNLIKNLLNFVWISHVVYM